MPSLKRVLPSSAALLALLASCAALAAPPDATAFSVTWLTPTPEPGRAASGAATYAGSMPMGNGALTAVAWANVSAGGVGVLVGHQDAMSSHTELYKLGLVQVALAPNPFLEGAFFNQTLDLSSATLEVFGGGSSMADYAVRLRVWIDANSDALFIEAASRNASRAFSLSATAASVRPRGVWNHTLPFSRCEPATSQPDVLVDPLPAPALLAARPPPQTPREAARHATGRRRPSRRLPLPLLAGFMPGSLVLYHRNAASDGLTVNETLSQQGCATLAETTPDFWQDLTSGFVLDSGTAGPALARVGAGALQSTSPAAAFELRLTALAVQTDTIEEWLSELAALVVSSTEGAPATSASPVVYDLSRRHRRRLHEDFWAQFWSRSWLQMGDTDADASSDADSGAERMRAATLGAALSQRYALTRYVQAIQSRGTQWPLKFNSMAFLAAMDDGQGAPDTRAWGPSNWFQNTRLAYENMLAAGDFDEFEVILRYYLNMVPLLTARSQLYWGHGGMWTPETHHLTGAYDVADYGCPGTRDERLPTWLSQSGYIKMDWGGNSGTGEYALMALDYLQATGGSDRAAFLPIAVAAMDFLMAHFSNRSAEGRVVVWPAQILESCWCDFDATSGTFVPDSCCADDTPTVSAMAALSEKLLALPAQFATDAQRAAWAAFQAILPPLPLTADGAAIAPGRVVNNCGHNGEGPELYAAHPHRLFTAGRAAAGLVNLSAAITALNRSSWSRGDDTWNYGIMAAALLGVDAQVTPKLIARATTYAPPAGYRFPGYSPSTGDGDPGLENASNGNRAIQDLLMQSGEDGFAAPKIVLFAGWPCAWDVSARLFAASNTTVEIDYARGALRSPLVVTPPARAKDVIFARCVS